MLCHYWNYHLKSPWLTVIIFRLNSLFPPSLAVFPVGLFPIQQGFYNSCCWNWILCAGFSPSILGWGFFSTLGILRSLDLVFTWDVTLIFYLCSITLIAWALQAILPLSSY